MFGGRWKTSAAWPSQQPGRSWEQPDPGSAGEGGKQLRQCRDAPALPDGAGSASRARGYSESEPVVDAP
jgi:hypothetical protein